MHTVVLIQFKVTFPQGLMHSFQSFCCWSHCVYFILLVFSSHWVFPVCGFAITVNVLTWMVTFNILVRSAWWVVWLNLQPYKIDDTILVCVQIGFKFGKLLEQFFLKIRRIQSALKQSKGIHSFRFFDATFAQ
jgi:hypothetical protein